jgi:Gas vesicle synthesis protein GvpL/GvpF
VIYAYAISEPAVAAPPPNRSGLGGAQLRVLEHDGLAVVYSRHRLLHPQPRTDLVQTHERVIEAIMARGPVLPLRFGARFEREEALSEVLAERRSELLRGLAYVRGRIEMGLRVTPISAAHDGRRWPTRSGRDYLLARVSEHRQGERAARDVHAPLAELSVASHVRKRPAPPAVLVASYLVEEGLVDAFRRCAERIAAAAPEDPQISVTGPWPPYSFTREPERP